MNETLYLIHISQKTKNDLTKESLYGKIILYRPRKEVNMEFIQSLSVPFIVGMVYAIIEWVKTLTDSERFRKFIPLIAVLIGAILGASAFYIYPSVIPADNIFMAIIIGAASGGSATCANQVYKQMKKGGE